MKNLKKSVGKTLPIVGGAIGARFIKNIAGKMIANDKIKAAAPLVAGILLMGAKSETMKGVGAGMVAVGGADLVGTFIPSLAGIEDMDLSGIFGDPLNAPDVKISGGDPLNGGSDYGDEY